MLLSKKSSEIKLSVCCWICKSLTEKLVAMLKPW